MKLKLRLIADGTRTDLLVTVDATVEVGELAEAIARRRPGSGTGSGATGAAQAWTLATTHGSGGESVLAPGVTVADSGLVSSSEVALRPVSGVAGGGATTATLAVVAGPDRGRRFDLADGSFVIGRSSVCDIHLSDALVSKRHARVSVADTVEITDLNSSNGVAVDGALASKVALLPGQRVELGDTVVELLAHTHVQARDAEAQRRQDGSVGFNRPPLVRPEYEGPTLRAPAIPELPSTGRFPWIPSIAPLIMGVVLFLITGSAASVAFVALSPIMAIGMFMESRSAGQRKFRRDREAFTQRLAELKGQLNLVHEEERAARLVENPPAVEMMAAARDRSPLLWFRRPEVPGFLSVRAGLGTQASRCEIDREERAQNGDPGSVRELDEVEKASATIAGVPVVVSFLKHGAMGVAGGVEGRAAYARGVLAQLTGSHSTSDLALVAFTSAGLIVPMGLAEVAAARHGSR